jgi:DMSO reductase anchor subunit
VRPRLRVTLLVLLAALTVVALARATAPAGAQSVGTQPDATTDDTPVPEQRIIPLPNTGHEPTDAGDPGGSLQIVVFVALVVGVSSIAALARRDIRKARRRAAAAEGGGQPSSGP